MWPCTSESWWGHSIPYSTQPGKDHCCLQVFITGNYGGYWLQLINTESGCTVCHNVNIKMLCCPGESHLQTQQGRKLQRVIVKEAGSSPSVVFKRTNRKLSGRKKSTQGIGELQFCGN